MTDLNHSNECTVVPLRTRVRAVLGETALYAAVFLVTLAAFLWLKPYYQYDGKKGVIAQSVVTFLLGLCLIVGIYLGFTKKLTIKNSVLLLLVAGLILRIGTMLCTPAGWYTSSQMLQMDTYTKNSNGHEGYAWRLFTTGKLPETNDYQFYHPPLNALLQAGFMHFMSGFHVSESFIERFSAGCPDWIEHERYFLYSSCQILAVLYSFVVCVISLKILKLLNVKDWAYVAVAAFVIFYPRGIQFSGALNNDGVAYMLSVMALYFVLKWWRKGKRLCDIIGCALGIGAGMMAKMSSATVCLPVAGIFIYEFVRTLKKREDALTLKKMIVQYAVFLVICAPLGLWFQVYAKIRFDQPFGYVFDKLNQRLSTAGHTAFERFFPIAFDSHEYFDSVWCHVFGWNYNLFHFALRSSIYGEFNEYTRGESVAIAAVTFAYIAVVLLIVVLVRATYLFFRYDLKRKDDKSKIEKENVFFVLLLMLSQILSMIYFNIKMPYACTMDFRYIMPMILGMGLTLWLSCGRLCRSGGRLSIALVRCTVAVCIAFLATSALFYITFI